MSFRLAPKSVTLNDPERRINGVKAITMRYFTEFGSLQAHCVKWLKIHRHFLQRKCSPKNLVFSDILFIAIFIIIIRTFVVRLLLSKLRT